MDQYPRATRPIEERGQLVTDDDRAISRRFAFDYFDGDRRHGYGGYTYHPRFWQPTVRRIRDHYGLYGDARLLDVGCAKGFMLHDFKELLPRLHVAGVDISEYALAHAMPDVRPYLARANARDLPFPDRSFNLVTAINTVHNLPLDECRQALGEIERVSRGRAFIVVDAWRNDAERERLFKWVVTCRTAMHVDDWKALFAEVGYTGDYYWFIAG
ncbi:MAG: class I SAM-dependent methyltransferase [Vicinamibacterales bacterium]